MRCGLSISYYDLSDLFMNQMNIVAIIQGGQYIGEIDAVSFDDLEAVMTRIPRSKHLKRYNYDDVVSGERIEMSIEGVVCDDML